jgi:hypothetical protein
MDFAFSPELERIQTVARELAQDFASRAARHDQEVSSPDENYAKLKEAGFYRLVAPKQYGGSGAGVMGWIVAAEELAQGCPSTSVSFNMHVATLATYLMKVNFDESYKQRLAEEVVKPDKLLAAILSEPGTTGLLPSTFACSTQARKVSGGWRLNGKKGFCTMAQSADVINIFAHPEESSDPEAALSFLISPKSAGIRVENNWNTLGMRATRSDSLTLEDVFVTRRGAILPHPERRRVRFGERASLQSALHRGLPGHRRRRAGSRQGSGAQAGTEGLQAVTRLSSRYSQTDCPGKRATRRGASHGTQLRMVPGSRGTDPAGNRKLLQDKIFRRRNGRHGYSLVPGNGRSSRALQGRKAGASLPRWGDRDNSSSAFGLLSVGGQHL